MTGAIAQVLVVQQNMAASSKTTEPVAGTGTIDAQGRVIVSITPPARTDAALVSKDGHVNYELMVTDSQGHLLTDYYFPRYYGSDPNMAREMPTFSNTHLTVPTMLESDLATTSATPDGFPLPNCWWVTVSQSDAYTVVGELHTVQDLSGNFSYGQTANSTIGVAINSNGDGWSLSGSASITNTLGSTVIQGNQAANWGKQLKTEFHYLEQQANCTNVGAINYYRVIASQWDGGMEIGNDVSSWDNNPNQWTTSVPGQGQFTRNSGTAYNYGGAVCVFGACLNASSGFSTNVQLHWTNTSQTTTRYLYGNNGYPTTATIIYASLS